MQKANDPSARRSIHQLTIIAMVAMLTSLVLAPAHAADAIAVSLKKAVRINRNAVRLIDIAHLSGGAAGQQETIGTTIVATSPLPGQTRFVGIDYIRIRLKQAGIDTDHIRFSGPSDVRITRESVALPVERIQRAVEASIRRRMPWTPRDVVIGDIDIDDTLELPDGKLTYRILPAANEDYLGRTVLAVHLFVDGEPVRKIWAQTTIAVMTDVVMVVRPLAKRKRIERADLTIVRRDLAALPAESVQRIDDAIGHRTTQMIYPQSILQPNMYPTPPVVQRGDIVKITAVAGPLIITATGKVKQQGRKGEMVRVVNTDSNRIITARVTGPGAVEVDF